MTKFIPVISILLLLCALSPEQVQSADQPVVHVQSSPTMKTCHTCSDDVFIGSITDTPIPTSTSASMQEIPIVHAVLFWMDGCPHCHDVLDNVLPPLQEKYGGQLEIALIEVVTSEDINHLYDVAARHDIPKEHVGVPFLIIGEHVLIGSGQIPAELPGLIETYLAQGGVALPGIPEFADHLPEESEVEEDCQTPLSCGVQTVTPGALVEGIMFNTPDCQDCQLIAAQVLKLAREDFDGQFTVETIDIVISEDVEYLYQVASAYGLSKEDVSLPLLIIGDQVLIEEEILGQLPGLLETTLEKGGAERPQLPPRTEPAEPSTPTPHQTPPPIEMRDNGFTLAIIVMVLMAAALVYSLASFVLGKTIALPAWADWLIPVLIVIGIGVAGYLSYVETQAVEAVCGPVGDCNTVQSSPYAYLFGVLPVGVLGLLGYLGLLGAWLTRRFLPRLERPAALAFWGMAVFAVAFSIYLTYLEPFVIKAVCAWCLTSSVIVTLLLLLGTPPAVRQFIALDEEF